MNLVSYLRQKNGKNQSRKSPSRDYGLWTTYAGLAEKNKDRRTDRELADDEYSKYSTTSYELR
jgi:hypothetical protein